MAIYYKKSELKKVLNKKTDFEIVKLIKSGSSEAFSVLYDRYVKLVYSKSFDFLKNKEKAEDLTHEIFIKIYDKISTYENDNFLGWISRLTYNSCVDDFRKNKAKNLTDEYIEIDNIDLVEDAISDEELFKVKYDQLILILDQIDIIDKEILLLKYKEELKITEISDLMQLSNSAVKMKINRAKKRIMEIYRINYQSNED